MGGRMRRARVVLWVGFLFQWSPFLVRMLYGIFYSGRRLICSWTFQKCGAESTSRTGVKLGFFRKLPEDRSPPEPLASSPVQYNCTNLGSASSHGEFLSSSCIFSQSTSFIVCSRPAAPFSAWCFLGVCISRNSRTSTLLWTRLGVASCFLEEMGRKKESRFNSACFLYLIPALNMAFWCALLLEVENLEDLGCVRGLSRGPCLGALTCPSTLIWCRLAPSRRILQRKAR